MPVWELIVVALLILLNGFFAMSELAVVSSRKVRLEQLAKGGSRGAGIALKLFDDPTRFLSTVQIGITLVGVLAGAFSGATLAGPLADQLAAIPALAGSAEAVAIALVVGAITYLSLVVGELVPKRIALNNAERIAAFAAPPMAALARLASPLVWFLRASTERVLRLIGVGPKPESTVTEEEVKSLIAQGAEAGVFHKAEEEMIHGVLRIADRNVRSIMTPRPDVIWLDPEDPPESIRREIMESGHSVFVVARDELDNFMGVVHTRDLLDRLIAGKPLDLRAAARDPLAIHESTPVLRLLDHFRGLPIHLAIVLDEYGSVEGIVTPMDVLTGIAGELREGGQQETPGAVRRADGSWLIDGRLPIHQVEEILGRSDMATRDYDTLAGFVLWRLGHVPSVSACLDWGGLRFEVVDMDGRRIDKVLVSVIDAAPAAGESTG